MTAHSKPVAAAKPEEPKLFGTYVEFDNVDSLLAACERVRDAGYTQTDAYTPFPVHHIDKALGIKPTILPWICIVCGLTGTFTALAMEIWMNAIDYKYIISGKPFYSLPAFIPVGFELTVLFAAFGAFFGMWALNKLPMFSNSVFTDPRFDRATDDRFFLFIDAKDPKYNASGVKNLFGSMNGLHVADIHTCTSSNKIPKFIISAVMLLALGATIPALLVARMRVTNSGSPRYHVIYDMDLSPSKDAQQTTTLFADSRAARPDVPGTVAVGQFNEELDYYTGIDMEALSRLDAPRASRLVRALLSQVDDEEPASDGDEPKPADEPAADEPSTEEKPADKPADDKPADEKRADEKPADDKTAEDKPADDKPADDKPADDKPADDKPAEDKSADEKMADEAKPAEEAKPAGDAKPADEAKPAAEPMKEEAKSTDEPKPAEQPAAPAPPAPAVDKTPWLKQNPLTVDQSVMDRGKQRFEIYCAVCHGNDGGGNGLVNRRAQRILATAWVQPSSLHQDTLYSEQYPDGKLFNTITNGVRKMPGYESQISTHDRWAIVAYVRALQTSQNAKLEDLPADKRNEIKRQQGEVQKRLAEQAEAEKKRAEEAAKKSS